MLNVTHTEGEEVDVLGEESAEGVVLKEGDRLRQRVHIVVGCE